MANFQIQDDKYLQIVPIARAAGLRALYGVGVAYALAQSKQSGNRDEDFNDATTGFEPDAFPDGNGGFKATEGWNGYMSSALTGMPVMSYLKFIGGSYIDLQGNEISIPDVIFETVIMTLSSSKDIVKTSISGRDSGSIKEYIGMGDWSIEIRAVITADAPVNFNVEKKHQIGRYPRENISEIMKIVNAPIAIPVESWYLLQYGIRYLVIESFNFEQVEGEYSVQRLVLNCVSDNPLIIKIAND